jgi:hypothetical protein
MVNEINTRKEYERYQTNTPDEKLPEWGSLAHHILMLPSKLYDEHENLITRFVTISSILEFIEYHRRCSCLTDEESAAMDNLYEVLSRSDFEIADKLCYGR